MDPELEASFLGGLFSGAAVWVVSAVLLALVAVVRRRRARRREIIALVNRAHAVVFSAMDEGLFDDAWVAASSEPLREAKTRYDDLSAQALNLFEPAESDVAFWCAVELYAGWRSPTQALVEEGLPRQRMADGTRILDPGSLRRLWALPRAELLAQWANVVWPWDRGNWRGPAYGSLSTPGDSSRHNIVIPNSDTNGDMLRPYATLIRPPNWNPSFLRARQLERMFARSRRADGAR